MLSQYYAPLLIASLASNSLAKSTKHTTTTTQSLSITTQSSSITSSAGLTSSATCAAAGANCYNSVIVSVTPCCDANAECVEGDTIATFTCEVIPPYTSPSPLPCAAVYGQCGSVYWTGPTCCEPGSTCVNLGSPYFYQCLPDASSTSTSTSASTSSSTSTSTSPTISLTSTSSIPSTTSSTIPTSSCAGEYNQCGGVDFTGPLCCSAGLVCVEFNDSPYFSTCQAALVRPRTLSHSTPSTVWKTTSVTLTGTSVSPQTITSSAVPTTFSVSTTSSVPTTSLVPTTTCATAGANCAATPCCDETLGCFSEPNLANIPTYTCVVPCAFEYGQCGGIGWPGPFCCQAGLTCVNEGSPYFYNCQS